MTTRSSHPLFSYADGVATGMTDALLLLGRVLIAVLFLMTVSTGGPAAAYLKSLNYPVPDVMSVLAHVIEWIVIISLIVGIGTRYGALLGFILRRNRLRDRAPLLELSAGRANAAIRISQ